jgi:hypothetical protein
MEDLEARELEARGSGGGAAAAAQLPTFAACLAAVVGATGVALAPVAPSLLARFVDCAVATCPRLSLEHDSHTYRDLKSHSSRYATLSESNWTLQVLATVTAFVDVVRAQASHNSLFRRATLRAPFDAALLEAWPAEAPDRFLSYAPYGLD